jgi:hypothetical protein
MDIPDNKKEKNFKLIKKIALIAALAVCINGFILIDRLKVDKWYMMIPGTLLSILLVGCYFSLSNSIGSEAIQKIQKDIKRNSEVIGDVKTNINGINWDTGRLNQSIDVVKGQLKKMLALPPSYTLTTIDDIEREEWARENQNLTNPTSTNLTS